MPEPTNKPSRTGGEGPLPENNHGEKSIGEMHFDLTKSEEAAALQATMTQQSLDGQVDVINILTDIKMGIEEMADSLMQLLQDERIRQDTSTEKQTADVEGKDPEKGKGMFDSVKDFLGIGAGKKASGLLWALIAAIGLAIWLYWDEMKELWTKWKKKLSEDWENVKGWADETMWQPMKEFHANVMRTSTARGAVKWTADEFWPRAHEAWDRIMAVHGGIVHGVVIGAEWIAEKAEEKKDWWVAWHERFKKEHGSIGIWGWQKLHDAKNLTVEILTSLEQLRQDTVQNNVDWAIHMRDAWQNFSLEETVDEIIDRKFKTPLKEAKDKLVKTRNDAMFPIFEEIETFADNVSKQWNNLLSAFSKENIESTYFKLKEIILWENTDWEESAAEIGKWLKDSFDNLWNDILAKLKSGWEAITTMFSDTDIEKEAKLINEKQKLQDKIDEEKARIERSKAGEGGPLGEYKTLREDRGQEQSQGKIDEMNLKLQLIEKDLQELNIKKAQAVNDLNIENPKSEKELNAVAMGGTNIGAGLVVAGAKAANPPIIIDNSGDAITHSTAISSQSATNVFGGGGVGSTPDDRAIYPLAHTA